VASEASEATADRLLGRIATRFEQAVVFPNSGVLREQFGKSLRATFEEPYVIYYVERVPDLLIIRVLHGARDATALLQVDGP
jgi:toxin ParE1/3/4